MKKPSKTPPVWRFKRSSMAKIARIIAPVVILNVLLFILSIVHTIQPRRIFGKQIVNQAVDLKGQLQLR